MSARWVMLKLFGLSASLAGASAFSYAAGPVLGGGDSLSRYQFQTGSLTANWLTWQATWNQDVFPFQDSQGRMFYITYQASLRGVTLLDAQKKQVGFFQFITGSAKKNRYRLWRLQPDGKKTWLADLVQSVKPLPIASESEGDKTGLKLGPKKFWGLKEDKGHLVAQKVFQKRGHTKFSVESFFDASNQVQNIQVFIQSIPAFGRHADRVPGLNPEELEVGLILAALSAYQVRSQAVKLSYLLLGAAAGASAVGGAAYFFHQYPQYFQSIFSSVPPTKATPILSYTVSPNRESAIPVTGDQSLLPACALNERSRLDQSLASRHSHRQGEQGELMGEDETRRLTFTEDQIHFLRAWVTLGGISEVMNSVTDVARTVWDRIDPLQFFMYIYTLSVMANPGSGTHSGVVPR